MTVPAWVVLAVILAVVLIAWFWVMRELFKMLTEWVYRRYRNRDSGD